MKRLTFFVFLAISFAFACNSSKQTTATTTATNAAQAPPADAPRPGGPRGDGQRGAQAQEEFQALVAELGLNEDQKEEWQSINTKYRQQMRGMREEANGDFASMRGKMQEMRAAQTEEIKAILTADQFSKYQKFMEERRANRQGRRRGGN